jgi:hypothetical protein
MRPVGLPGHVRGPVRSEGCQFLFQFLQHA